MNHPQQQESWEKDWDRLFTNRLLRVTDSPSKDWEDGYNAMVESTRLWMIEAKAFIQDLLDRKAEAYIEKLKNEIDDWYTLPPAYRNKAELKGRLDQALSILKEE